MAVSYSYKITPTGRITYLKNDKRVAKAEIPAKTLARLEKEIAGTKAPAKKGVMKKKATKKVAPKKRAAKVTFEDDDTIPLPPMMNPSSDDVEDMLIIENYNKCTEKCDWGENACNVDTGRCIKKLKNGGVPKAYNSFKSGNKTIVSKKLSDEELKDKISIALKPKRKAAPKKKASPKKKAPVKKTRPKKIADVIIRENLVKCNEKCDWKENACNIDTGRCIKKLKSGGVPKAYASTVRGKHTMASKKLSKEELDDQIDILVRPQKLLGRTIFILPKKKRDKIPGTTSGASKKKAKRCDDVDDYVECADGKICNAATGRCIADNSKNRSGMMQIEVDGRIIVGKANVIAKLSTLFSGAKIGPALVTTKPKGGPKGKQAPKTKKDTTIQMKRDRAIKNIESRMRSLIDDDIEERMTPDRSIGNTNAAIKQLADIKKFNPSNEELAIASDLIRKGKKFIPELKAIQKKKEELIKTLNKMFAKAKKDIENQTNDSRIQEIEIDVKPDMDEAVEKLFAEFDEIESRRVKEFGSPATILYTHLAAGGELINMPIRSTSRSASKREFEEQIDGLYSLALRMPVIDIVDIDAARVSDGMKLLEEAKDSGDKAKINRALKEGKSILSQINRLEKRKDAFLEKVGDRIEAHKKKLKGVYDVDAVVTKVAETDITSMVIDFNQTLSGELGLLQNAIQNFLKDVRTFAEIPEEIRIPSRRISSRGAPPPLPRRSPEKSPPPLPFREPERRSSKGPMDVMIPGTSPSSRLSAVMGAERPDFERIVSTAIEDATASARKTPPPLAATSTRRRSAEPDIIDKTKLNIEKAFERCLVELDK